MDESEGHCPEAGLVGGWSWLFTSRFVRAQLRVRSSSSGRAACWGGACPLERRLRLGEQPWIRVGRERSRESRAEGAPSRSSVLLPQDRRVFDIRGETIREA